MRRVVAGALVFVAGCSVLFDMDPYDRGGGTSGTSSSGNGGDGSTTDGGDTNDGGGSVTDAGGDAPPGCTNETEPNDQATSANPLDIGQTCGVLSSPTDEDFFAFLATTSVKMIVTIPSGARLEVFRDGSATPAQTYSGSGGTVTSPAGSYLLRVTSTGSGPPGPKSYTVGRAN